MTKRERFISGEEFEIKGFTDSYRFDPEVWRGYDGFVMGKGLQGDAILVHSITESSFSISKVILGESFKAKIKFSKLVFSHQFI